jgi:transposase
MKKKYNFRDYNQDQALYYPIMPKELIDEENPAYIFSYIIEKLDLTDLYEKYPLEGNPAYHPKMMLKVLFYSYYISTRSSRKIRAALQKGRADYIYISGGQCPDHRTINEFRTKHPEVLSDLFTQIVLLCDKLDMISLEHLALDGQKIQANASFKNSYDEKRLKKRYEKIKDAVSKIIETPVSEHLTNEKKLKRVARLKKQMDKLDKVAEKLQSIKEPKKKEKAKINTTDSDAKTMTHKDSTKKPSYNHQSAVDKKYGVTCAIKTKDNVDEAKDLIDLVETSKKNIGKSHANVSADSAFSSMEVLDKIMTDKNDESIYYIPDRFFKDKSEKKYFPKSKFKQLEGGDVECPAGHCMNIISQKEKDNTCITIYEGIDCQACQLKSKCTKSKKRKIQTDSREILVKRMRARLNSEEGRERYRERQWIVEAGHGDDQKNKNWTQHSLRGKEKAELEFTLIRLAANIGKIFKYKRRELLAA